MTDNPPRAALWDMDGTLLDSAGYHWLAWRDTLEAENHPITYDEFVATFGQRNDTILRGYFGPDLADAEVGRIGDAKEVRYRQLVRERGVALLPGVRRWLERLHAAGWRQAIASAAPRANVEAIVAALDIGSFFGALVSAEDVQRGKPDPQVLRGGRGRAGRDRGGPSRRDARDRRAHVARHLAGRYRRPHARRAARRRLRTLDW